MNNNNNHTSRKQRQWHNASTSLICIALIFFIDGIHETLAFSLTSIPRSRTTTTRASNNFVPSTKIRGGTGTPTSLHAVSSSISTATGEADRAFRLGIQLEKAGLARAASAAFHEAATLYQCFLDQSPSTNSFQHVTSLALSNTDEDTSDSPTVLAVLAYACIRLAHLSHDAFGDSRASTRLYKLAASVDPNPGGVAYHGIGSSIEASITHSFIGQDERVVWRGEMEKAVMAYREASELGGGLGSNCEVLFHLAVALERLEEVEESERIMETLRRGESNLSSLVDSWGYVRWHTRRTNPHHLNLHRGTRAMLQIAFDAAQPLLQHDDGLVCEFGVASGRSLRMTQELLPLETPIHGFDTFTGLPVAWGNEPAGSYSTGGAMPKMDGTNIHFIKGLFKDTIPEFLSTVDKGRPLAYANIDCDLYGSTRDVLEAFHGRIIPGTVIVFDEYLCHASWRQDEFRAWRECCKRFGWQYEYLAFSLSTKQAVVRVTS
eukprot:CAMPEP_0172297804 /NCGR_PEP_ID=MMETSP1058-20130122/695_1 /TAXON_ID=83371 /ORGANISM="Detonula confervacea, Strain CCMP 353" /LENGTH=490 /DNA_ID=CAMNT_0013006997 /DNA_START=46 /DNA_END=1518 /DNA_ORIENTATION=+